MVRIIFVLSYVLLCVVVCCNNTTEKCFQYIVGKLFHNLKPINIFFFNLEVTKRLTVFAVNKAIVLLPTLIFVFHVWKYTLGLYNFRYKLFEFFRYWDFILKYYSIDQFIEIHSYWSCIDQTNTHFTLFWKFSYIRVSGFSGK